LRIARTSGPWRDLPEIFGNRNTTFNRFRYRVRADVFSEDLDVVSNDPEVDSVMIGGSIVRVHRHGQDAMREASDASMLRVASARRCSQSACSLVDLARWGLAVWAGHSFTVNEAAHLRLFIVGHRHLVAGLPIDKGDDLLEKLFWNIRFSDHVQPLLRRAEASVVCGSMFGGALPVLSS